MAVVGVGVLLGLIVPWPVELGGGARVRVRVWGGGGGDGGGDSGGWEGERRLVVMRWRWVG